MSLPDRDKQKASIDRELIKFSELIPSVRTVQPPINKALALIDGSSKSRAAVLLAEELNRKNGTKIDVLCFYSEQHQTDTLLPSKESYDVSFAFAYEHLKSEDFEIKGQVLEDITMFNQILDAILNSGEYDLIIIPSSFIGIRKTEITTADDESDAKITVMGDIFEFLIQGNNIPLLLVESEKINIEQLWNNIGIIVNSHTNLRYCIEKAIQFSNKKAQFHAIIAINPQYHEDLVPEEFEELCKKQKEEMDIFSRANSEVFKDISRFIDYNLLSTNKIKEVKDLLISFGKDIGILIFYLHSKHASLYGLFIDMLTDPDIVLPILITKKEVKEEDISKKEETSEEEISEEEISEEEERIKIDESVKKAIKEEVKRDIISETKTSKEEVKKEIVEEEPKKEEAEKEEKEEELMEQGEKEEIEDLKEEVKEEVLEEIKKEVIKEVKEEPKKELKKVVAKALKESDSIENLKESIIEEIKEEIVDEIVYELRHELKKPKKELKKKVKEEIKEEAAKGQLKVDEEKTEEDEELAKHSDFE